MGGDQGAPTGSPLAPSICLHALLAAGLTLGHAGTHTHTYRHTASCWAHIWPCLGTCTHTQNIMLACRFTKAFGHVWACAHMRTHTHMLSWPARLLTVSGLFLSLSSFRSKHWLMMGFLELHMVCEGTAGVRVAAEQRVTPLAPRLSPPGSSPPSSSGKEGHCFYPETLAGENKHEARDSLPPAPTVGT